LGEKNIPVGATPLPARMPDYDINVDAEYGARAFSMTARRERPQGAAADSFVNAYTKISH
jgi:hypothetical protein